MPSVTPNSRRAFPLIELLVVIAVIVILAAITVPALRSLTKSNDTAQAANVVRSYIAAARSAAVNGHRMAGVVFFEESADYSRPVNANQTAMQLFVEDYNQAQYTPNNTTVFIKYSSDRQYLPGNVRLAALSDLNNGSVATAENNTSNIARAIIFDANGQLITIDRLATPSPGAGGANQGQYPEAYGDWKFLTPNGATPAGPAGIASSSPGFFLYSKADYDAQTAGYSDAQRFVWIRQHADVVIVNAYTGNVIR